MPPPLADATRRHIHGLVAASPSHLIADAPQLTVYSASKAAAASLADGQGRAGPGLNAGEAIDEILFTLAASSLGGTSADETCW